MVQKISRFERLWKELKRRKVIHVITVYASASFGIIEIVNNLTVPLRLPGSISTIATIVLAVGFPFAIIVSWLYDLTGGTFERTKPMEDTQAEEKVKVHNAWKIATYISFVVITGLIVLNIARGSNIIKPGMVHSLVILPFNNYTGDEKLDYFVSGMHSSLISDVGKIGSLRVISKTTSDVYRNVRKSLPQIASELNVNAVVEAQVMCLGDSICLQVRVVTADRKEKQLWAGDYKWDKTKILSLYDRITKQIAEEVMVKLSHEEEQLLARSITVDRESYDLYMKGEFYCRKLTPDGFETALKYFELAKDKDPGFAPAYAGICFVWAGRQQMGITPPAEARPRIMEAAMKAVELDSTSGVVHYCLALVNTWTLWDWEEGEKEFRKALEINPNHAEAHAYYAHLLALLGRSEEALKQIKIALNLDPLNALISALYEGVLDYSHKHDEAVKACQDALKIENDYPFAHSNLGLAYAFSGKYKEAVEQWKLAAGNDIDLVTALEKGYAKGGFKEALLEYNEVVELRFKNSYWNPLDIAINYSLIEENDKAFFWLEKAYNEHNPGMPYLLYPWFENLHDDPRFKAYCQKMKLPYK